jgi:hypothetical protein
MPQVSFPDPRPDDRDDDQSPEQGLYITLPAEHLTLSGFNQGGASATRRLESRIAWTAMATIE